MHDSKAKILNHCLRKVHKTKLRLFKLLYWTKDKKNGWQLFLHHFPFFSPQTTNTETGRTNKPYLDIQSRVSSYLWAYSWWLLSEFLLSSPTNSEQLRLGSFILLQNSTGYLPNWMVTIHFTSCTLELFPISNPATTSTYKTLPNKNAFPRKSSFSPNVHSRNSTNKPKY